MLQKFLRVAGDMISAPMYVAYVQMLTSLANTPTNSQCCFVLLRSSGPTWRVSLEHIFGSIRQYFVSLKQDGSSGGSVEGRSSRSTSGLRQNITGGELAGLVSVLRLVEQLVLQVRLLSLPTTHLSHPCTHTHTHTHTGTAVLCTLARLV